jgi:DNA-binding CsgD family transcriptional regulator
MIPALTALYLLFIGLAAWGSLVSLRLRPKDGRPFMRTFHLFVLLSFVYALVNFIGEVIIPVVFPGPSETLVGAYLTVDLLTIPLLGILFFLLFSWITALLGRTPGGWPAAAFWAAEALYLAAFIISFVSYFIRGITPLTYISAVILNGIILSVLVAAVLALLVAAPRGDDPAGRRLARGLGLGYAVSLTALVAVTAAARRSVFGVTTAGRILPAAAVFLVNVPALVFLRRALASWASSPAPDSAESAGLDVMAGQTGLSDREKEVVRLIARGLDTREIGKALFISPKTVKNHLTSIYAKTGVRNRVQLVNRLREKPFTSPPSSGI